MQRQNVLNPSLKKYVTQHIFPLYAKNDQGHGIEHIEEVIRRSFELNQAFNLNLDPNMIYVIAACHDLGKYLDHEKHHLIAAQQFDADQFFQKAFTATQKKMIREAIEDHRSSKADTPRSNYGKLISSADRNASIRIVFIRSFYVALERMPEMQIEAYLEYTLQRLRKKYDEKDPENMFYEDERYRKFLQEMRTLLTQPEAFKKLYCEINHIQDRQITVAAAHQARQAVLKQPMQIVFATTNQRKVADLAAVLQQLKIDNLEILSLTDIGWQDEIAETGTTCDENSRLKAETIYQYCQAQHLPYGVLADDSGLFVEALNGAPGVYTARYAEAELKQNPHLPKHECVYKLLRNMAGVTNRKAYYRSVVTLLLPDGKCLVSEGVTKGHIAEKPVAPMIKPYFYTIFMVDKYQKTFNCLTLDETKDTYRNLALKNIFQKLQIQNKKLSSEQQMKKHHCKQNLAVTKNL